MTSETVRLSACYRIPKLDVAHRVSRNNCAVTNTWLSRCKASEKTRRSPKNTYRPNECPFTLYFLSSHPVLDTTSFYVPLAYRGVGAACDKPCVRPFIFVIFVIVALFRSALLVALACFAKDRRTPCNAEYAALDSVEATGVG